VRRALLPVLALALFPVGSKAQDKVIDLRNTRQPGGESFEVLWQVYRKAEVAGDQDRTAASLKEIRWLRLERNIPSLEEVGLAFVAQGVKAMTKGDTEHAVGAFRNARVVDPHLPDGYFGLARAEVRSGAFGWASAVPDTLAGMGARRNTSRGQYYLLALLIPAVLLGVFAATVVTALALLLRDGPLLLHDIEESVALLWGHGLAVGIFGVLLLLPTATLQGYGWLPLWWFALLFLYLQTQDRIVIAVVLAGFVTVPVAARVLEDRAQAVQNPLFRAAMLSIEGATDRATIDELEKAVTRSPDDMDLSYLLGLAYKKAGEYDDSADLYRRILQTDKDNAVALNNLANIEFARQEFQAAIARYKQGVEGGGAPDVVATFQYNLNFAYLHRFEPEPAREARSEAERLAGSLVKTYDSLWSRDDGNAVVDLAPSRSQLWAKFDGFPSGVGVKNVMKISPAPFDPARLGAQLMNRFVGFLGVLAVTVLVLSRWRGNRAFTMRCLKCGTPFCKKCHLGAAVQGLCTQCHHLFVVRDGVSGPARNQKLLEVQKEDARRERLFRALSLVSPGTGHVYAHRMAAGFLIGFAWYTGIVLLYLAGRVLPVTEASPALGGDWGLYVGGLFLVLLYVASNRARPDFEVSLPGPRTSSRPRKGR
jgi:tetratricopeptide (TPR) repeat protein